MVMMIIWRGGMAIFGRPKKNDASEKFISKAIATKY